MWKIDVKGLQSTLCVSEHFLFKCSTKELDFSLDLLQVVINLNPEFMDVHIIQLHHFKLQFEYPFQHFQHGSRSQQLLHSGLQQFRSNERSESRA